MRKPKVSFFTEAGLTFGMGHLMRCIALAEAFQESNICSQFIVHKDLDFDFKDNFPLKSINWKKELVYPLNTNNIAVVDSYYIDHNHIAFFSKNFHKVIYFDDKAVLYYPKGYVINGIIRGEDIKYKKNNSTKYLLGAQYQVVRKAFWNIPKYKVQTDIHRILIIFGGSDLMNMTPYYLSLMCELFPKVIKSVVIGQGGTNIDEIKSNADKNTEIFKNLSDTELVDLMFNSDVAISSAGQTLSELAIVGVPTFSVKIIENQSLSINNWRSVGYLLSEKEMYSGFQYNARLRSHRPVESIIDGNGARRVVRSVLKDEVSSYER
jgi:spore coat polysaccharide biosynthesis predicted glycosyltransferase SpsG